MGLVAAAAVVTGVGVVTGVTSGELWIFFGFGGARLGNGDWVDVGMEILRFEIQPIRIRQDAHAGMGD
jgi:hypothetical protein